MAVSKPHRLALVAACSGLLSACVTTVAPPPPAVLEYATTGCAAAPDLTRAISLTPERETNGFTVTAPMTASPCLSEAWGATPYLVFALPADFADKTIDVGGVLEPLRIVSPAVTLLDAEGTPTRTLAVTDFFHRGAVYSAQFRPRANERYLLVTVNAERVGQSYDALNVGTNTTTVYTGYGVSQWTSGVEARMSRQFSYEGATQVIVYDTDTRERPAA